MPILSTAGLPTHTVDVLVIGGGIVGCAILRRLAESGLRVALCEAASDVGQGISKANTAIAHTGFDAPPGSLEARLITESHWRFPALCAELGVQMRPCGALMVALDQDDHRRLDDYVHKAALNGIHVERIGRDALLARRPYLNPQAQGGLWIPGETPVDSFALTIAIAEAAVRSGATILLDEPAVGIEPLGDTLQVRTRRHRFIAQYVVNAAGLGAAQIAGMVGDKSFAIRPRKGQLIVVDPADAPPIDTILLPTPSPTTKGVLITPAAHGNLLLGPTAEDGDDPNDWSTTADGLALVIEGVRRLVPSLVVGNPVTQYAGLRSVGYLREGEALVPAKDYIVGPSTICPQLIHVAGIRSTGLSASPALAEHVAGLLGSQGLEGRRGTEPQNRRTAELRDPGAAEPQNDAVPHYTDPQIVCPCSGVTAGQVRAAIHGLVPAQTLDALKRRLWTMAGPCQGTHCIAPLVQLLADKLGCDLGEVRKNEVGSEVLRESEVGAEPRVQRTKEQKNKRTNVVINSYQAEDVTLSPCHLVTLSPQSSIVHRPDPVYPIVVIGAGPAGIAAAQAAHDAGTSVLLVDRADGPGGALVAMGLAENGSSGDPPATSHQLPATGHKPIDALFQTALIGTEALDGNGGLLLNLQGPGGLHQVTARALVLATGGREPTRGNLLVPGTRPAGVLTAGAVLRLLAATGRLPGRRAVISGGGRWAERCAERIAAAGVEVVARTPGIAAIEGWPRLSAVATSGGQRIACDLLVLAEEVQPWPAFPPGPNIFYTGSASLGPCDAEAAAAHGAEVGTLAAAVA